MDQPGERSGARSPGQVGPASGFRSRLAEAVAEFGATVRLPLAAGLGHAEDQIAGPAARLVRSAGSALGLDVVTHAETPLSELSIRPDFAVYVADGAAGFIEVKRPGKGANPTAWSTRSHDGRQWQKMCLLPNVLYTDGANGRFIVTGSASARSPGLPVPLTARDDPSDLPMTSCRKSLRSFCGIPRAAPQPSEPSEGSCTLVPLPARGSYRDPRT